MADKRVAIELLFASKGAKEAAGYNRDFTKSVDDMTKKLKNADFSAVDTALSKFNRGSYTVDPRVTNSLETVTKGAKTAGDATKLASYQAKQLSFQINDVVAQLSTGTPVWRILMQQGGQVTQIYGGVGATFAALLPKIVAFAPAVAAAAAGIAALRGVNAGREAAKSLTELADQAQAAKVSIEGLQRFIAAGAGNGVGTDQVVSGLAAVSTTALKAADDQKKYYEDLQAAESKVSKGVAGSREELAKLEANKPGDIFSQLGVSMTNFNGRADESIPIIRKLADRLAAMPDGIRKAQFVRLAEQSFGAGFTKILLGGSKAIDEYEKKLDSLVPKLRAPEIEAAKAEISLSGLLDAAKKRAEDQFGAAFIPAANALDRYLISKFKTTSQTVKDFANEVRAFFEILNGNTEEAARHPALKLIADGYSRLVKITKGLGTVVGEGFVGIAKGADKAFDGLNKMFGTDWDAGSAALIASIGLVLARMTPLGNLISLAGLRFIGLGGIIAGVAVTVASYSDKIRNAIDPALAKFYEQSSESAKAVAAQKRAEGNLKAAENAEARATELLQKRDRILAEVKQREQDAAKYAGMTAGEEYINRLNDTVSGIGAAGSNIWNQLTNGADTAGNVAGKKVGDAIAQGAKAGADKAATELKTIDVASNQIEGRIIKRGNVVSTLIPKDGQLSDPRLVKGANVSLIDTASRHVDQPGLEGIDKSVGLGKVAIDQIEKVKAGKRDIAQPTAVALDASQADQVSRKLDQVAEKKRSIEVNIIKGSQVTTTEVPVEQPAAAVAQKTAETAANIGTANTNVQTLTQSVQGAASATDGATDSARRLADEYQRAKENAGAINPGNGPTPTGGDGATPLTFADGGFVSGPGSGTSDSIPAWLSNGEFVTKASAVKKPGVLSLLRAINGGVDFPSLFGGRRRFANGGLVGALPAIASAPDGQSVHVHFDGVSIGPMKADRGVVDQLLREEAKRRVSSAGRAPSRVG